VRGTRHKKSPVPQPETGDLVLFGLVYKNRLDSVLLSTKSRDD